MFSDSNEVEDNLRACENIVDQSIYEYLKQEEVYGHRKSDMGFNFFQYANASLFYFDSSPYFEINRSYFSVLKADDCLEKEFAKDADIFVSEKFTAPRCIDVDIRYRLSFLAYDDL